VYFQVINNVSISEKWRDEAGLSSMEVMTNSEERNDILMVEIFPNPYLPGDPLKQNQSKIITKEFVQGLDSYSKGDIIKLRSHNLDCKLKI
jgi:hypothetical protein